MAAVNDYGAKICVKTIRFPVSEDAESEVPFIFLQPRLYYISHVQQYNIRMHQKKRYSEGESRPLRAPVRRVISELF